MSILADEPKNRGISRIDEVLAAAERFGLLRKTSEGWQGICPSHNDHSPSLSISQKPDGIILIHCHAKCSTESVMDKYGLPMSILFPPKDPPIARVMPLRKKPEVAKRKVAAYEYLDKTGKVLYVLERYEPKEFRADRKVPVEMRVIYRLPDVLEAVTSGVTVYVCEGEKDSDRLVAEGYVATTNPFGAGNWRPQYADHFAGVKRVEIIADHDAAGSLWAKSVAESLVGIVDDVSIWVYESDKAGSDVSDLFDAGLGLAYLTPLDLEKDLPDEPDPQTIEGAVERRRQEIRAGSFWLENLPESKTVTPLVEGLISEATMILLYGASNTGKSYVALDLALSIAHLDDWHGHRVTKTNVGIVANERFDTWQQRSGAWLKHHGIEKTNESVRFWHLPNRPQLESLDADLLVAECLEHGIGLIIWDTLRSSTVGRKENDVDDWAEIESAMSRFTSAGIAIMITHHVGKDPSKGARGSSGIYASVDTALFLTKEAGGTMILTDAATKGKQNRRLAPEDFRGRFVMASVEGTENDLGMAEGVVVLASEVAQSDSGFATAEKVSLLLDVLNYLDQGRGISKREWQKEYNDKATGRGLSKFTSENSFARFVDPEVLAKGYANQEKGKAVFRADPIEDYDDE